MRARKCRRSRCRAPTSAVLIARAVGERTGEIESMQAKIREIQAAGDEHAWIAAREAERKCVGQATFVIARKAA